MSAFPRISTHSLGQSIKQAPPPPFSHHFFYSKGARKTCFYCHYIDNPLCKTYNGTKVRLITNRRT